MSSVSEAVKHYWPWVLGGVAGLWVISKMGGSAAPADNGASAYAQMLQSQQAAAQQNAQLVAQQNAMNQQNAQQSAQLQAAHDIAMMQRDVSLANTAASVAASDNATAVNFTLANAQLAAGAGTAASGIIAALNMPAVTAMNAMSNENAAALQSAAISSSASFIAQSKMISDAGNALNSIPSSFANSPWGSNQPTIAQYSATAQSTAAAAQSSAQSAQAVSQANASGTSSMFGGLSSLAMLAMM